MRDYIEERSGGLYVNGTRVSLASVIFHFRQGASPETILQNFPSLGTLAMVYGAITYYLENQAALGEYIKAQEQQWQDFQNSADPMPSVNPRREQIRQ